MTAPLNQANAIVALALRNALAAVHHLNDLGATVLRVELGERNPVIEIDIPRSVFLTGSVKTRIKVNGEHRIVMATRVCQCQVQWRETYALPMAEAAHV